MGTCIWSVVQLGLLYLSVLSVQDQTAFKNVLFWPRYSLPDFYCCNAGYDNQDMEDDVVFDGGYQVPGSVYSRLFDYQKTGILLQINRETAVNSWHGRCMHSGYNMCHQSAESTYSVYSRHCCSGNPGGKLIVQ